MPHACGVSFGGCPYGFVKGSRGECELGLGSRSCRRGHLAVAESGAEHGVDDVAAAAGEADDGGVVELAFGALAGVVVGLARLATLVLSLEATGEARSVQITKRACEEQNVLPVVRVVLDELVESLRTRIPPSQQFALQIWPLSEASCVDSLPGISAGVMGHCHSWHFDFERTDCRVRQVEALFQLTIVTVLAGGAQLFDQGLTGWVGQEEVRDTLSRTNSVGDFFRGQP